MSARSLILAWAESGGFAATHAAGASSEAIADDLIRFLREKGYGIVPREPTVEMELAPDEIFATMRDGHHHAPAAEVWQAMFDAALAE